MGLRRPSFGKACPVGSAGWGRETETDALDERSVLNVRRSRELLGRMEQMLRRGRATLDAADQSIDRARGVAAGIEVDLREDAVDVAPAPPAAPTLKPS
jgi:hypothetical protein